MIIAISFLGTDIVRPGIPLSEQVREELWVYLKISNLTPEHPLWYVRPWFKLDNQGIVQANTKGVWFKRQWAKTTTKQRDDKLSNHL